MTSRDDDRIAYLAGEAVTSLSPDEQAVLDALREELRSPVTWEEPDPDLEDRVVSAIAAEADAGPRAPATPRPRRRSWRVWGWRPTLALSGLAVAVIAAIVIVTSVGGGTSAEQFAMAVVGTPLAPAAHGSATLTKMASGWRIELKATGLPRRQGKDFYQAWLKNAAGVLVPVGTFNDARDVTLWSGVPVTAFRTLTVTEQVANGDPASSGRRVLIGTIH